MSILFKLSEKGYHLNGDPFFDSNYYRKVCIKSRKLGLKIAKFSKLEGAHPPQTPPFQTRKSSKMFLIIYKKYFACFNQ